MNNFNLKKYLAEGRLFESINLDIEDDIAILSGDSGEYEGEIKDGKVSFSIIYDNLDFRITDKFNKNNIEDFLGKSHAFVELAKKYDHNWDIERDLVGITIKL
jgi:poly(A) polymerase Pap1|tara:strand:+ start:2227 stop:2535 length:309 start_codon:yes stop_codon:yes gene_type:complete